SFGIPLHVASLTPNHFLEFCSGSLVFAIFLCPSFSCARYHLLRGSSTSGADDDPELLHRLQASAPSTSTTSAQEDDLVPLLPLRSFASTRTYSSRRWIR